MVGRFVGEPAGGTGRGAVGGDRQQPQRRLGDQCHPAAVGRPHRSGGGPVGQGLVGGGQVALLGARAGVEDADEVIALAETVVEPVAVAEGHVPAVGRPGRGARRPVGGQRPGQHPLLTGAEVAQQQGPGQVLAGEAGAVRGQRRVQPAGAGDRFVLPAVQVQSAYGRQPVPVRAVQQAPPVRCPRGHLYVMDGGGLDQLAGHAVEGHQPQGVQRDEGHAVSVGRQGGQVDAAHRPGGVQGGLFGAPAGAGHGHVRGEGKVPRRAGRVEGADPDPAVGHVQDPVVPEPARRGRRQILVVGQEVAVDQERGPRGRKGRGGRGSGQVQPGDPAGGRHRGAQQPPLPHAVDHLLRAAADGHADQRQTAVRAAVGGVGRSDAHHRPPVRPPRRIEVLERPAGEAHRPAAVRADGPQPERRPRHGVSPALGREHEPGTVRRPGHAPVVPGPVGDPAQPAAVGPQGPQMEAAALVAAHRQPCSVR
ncbi:hypothetical protein TUE45_pSRTUE45c_0570 (plasmid) [Streptomyces reticuli]|nr:hypothetical protein TUE45_pSRTUE45c_0570 [Streptomyces reticuli]